MAEHQDNEATLDGDVLKAFRFDTLMEAFSPSAPIDREEIFAGRDDRLAALATVIRQRGQHAVIYGERGVGKTSLARICAERARGDSFFVANVTCDSGESFLSIWTKVFEEMLVEHGGKQGTRCSSCAKERSRPTKSGSSCERSRPKRRY